MITSDGYEGYSDAILSVYGEFDSMTRKLQSPKSLCYGQIIKRIEKGRCKKVDKSLIFGDQKLLDEYIANSSVSHQMNTFAVERREENQFKPPQQWLQRIQIISGLYKNY